MTEKTVQADKVNYRRHAKKKKTEPGKEMSRNTHCLRVRISRLGKVYDIERKMSQETKEYRVSKGNEKTPGLGVLLKTKSACLASIRLWFNPQYSPPSF
jgi:hypothetical protein